MSHKHLGKNSERFLDPLGIQGQGVRLYLPPHIGINGKHPPEEASAVDPVNRQRVTDGDLDVGALAFAAIENAVKTLKRGDPRDWTWKNSATRYQGMTKQEATDAYLEAQWWIFLENDEGGDRPFSLTWCCDLVEAATGLALLPEWIRKKCREIGIVQVDAPQPTA